VTRICCSAYVRFWHKADIRTRSTNVRLAHQICCDAQHRSHLTVLGLKVKAISVSRIAGAIFSVLIDSQLYK
jgi:hypothetical protein